MTYSMRLSKGCTAALLASVYILGFIITPYWLLHASAAADIFYLALTISIGLIWLWLSANSLEIPFSLKDIGVFFFLLAGVIALNYRALNSVIPFRGDEASHIERTLELADRIPFLPGLILLALFVVFIAAGMKGQKWGAFIGISIVAGTVFYFWGRNSFEDVLKGQLLFFLRWPFINYWIFTVFPKLASLISHPYHEALYRIIPVLSMLGVSWIYQRKARAANLLNNIAWGLAVATIPLVFYYSSILYIEPLAVFLMTVVCLNAEHLLRENSQSISHIPAWYALLLIGFIKETTVPFLLCFIAVRMIVQVRTWSRQDLKQRSENPLRNLLTGEFKIAFALLAPIALYLYFRATLTSTRSFIPDITNLFDSTNYYFVILSLLQQFGPFLLLFLAGCVLFLRDREFIPLFYYLATMIATLTFHMVDHKGYIGYSRFNLFILPAILAGSIKFVTWASKQKPYAASILISIAIGSNLLLSPVHLDGVKTAYWGNYLADTSEHYYPYQDALMWLKSNYADRRMLFTGMDFYYPFEFYWNKLDWKPRKDGIPSEGIADKTLAISSLLNKAEDERYSIVIYRVTGNNFKLPDDTGKFRVQIIRNSAHTLLIFYKP